MKNDAQQQRAALLSDKHNKPIAIGLGFIAAMAVAYFVLSMAGVLTQKVLCLVFLVASVIMTELINAKYPKDLLLVDSTQTPTTSAMLGNKITRMGLSFVIVEALVVAVFMVHPLSMALTFFILIALMIVYVSFVAYFVRSNEELKEDGASAGVRKLGKKLDQSNMDAILDSLKKAQDKPAKEKTHLAIKKTYATAKESPLMSYEATVPVEQQLILVTSELKSALDKGDAKFADECASLILILLENRSEMFK